MHKYNNSHRIIYPYTQSLYLYILLNRAYNKRRMAHLDKEDFRRGVYDVVRSIPYGRATSYGAIAKAIGYPNMSRLVGRVMGECDSVISGIPAYRVVNSQGVLSAKEAFGNSNEMQKLLEEEGVNIINDRIANWKKVFWDPTEELTIE